MRKVLNFQRLLRERDIHVLPPPRMVIKMRKDLSLASDADATAISAAAAQDAAPQTLARITPATAPRLTLALERWEVLEVRVWLHPDYGSHGYCRPPACAPGRR